MSSEIKTSSKTKPDLKTFLYRVTADIKRLKIQKHATLKTKIVWKRHHQKAETNIVEHAHGFSTHNQKLTLTLDISYDPEKEQYQPKMTQIVAVILVDDQTKSGGYAKIDIADPLNRNLRKQDIIAKLSGCPDPDGYVQLTLEYEQLQQALGDQMSIWNASSRDFNMSKLDLSEHKTEDLKDINLTVDKLKQLTKKIKEVKQNNGNNGVLFDQKIQILEGENKQLRSTVDSLESKFQDIQKKWKIEKLQLQKQITGLQKVLQKKSKQLSQKSKELITATSRQKPDVEYQDKLKELQEDSFQGGNQKNPFQSEQFVIRNSTIIVQQKMQSLQRQKLDLQSKVAEMSINMAKLFNAAVEIGGPQLLDRLQQSMGLQ